ncbi:MAG: DUF86 domain-containing protein [Acetobacteraceae bacterium]|nr:DUF86 domain-containing protein [Acetobacteraceae bacterium]
MRRDPRSFLWDVRDAADAIFGFVEGRVFSDYVADRMFRSAIERQFEIVGEALSQLARVDAALATRIPELRRIAGFRNVLIHGYDRIDDRVVWRAISDDLPPLRAQVAALLTERGDLPG